MSVVLLCGIAVAATPFGALALTPIGIGQLSGTNGCVSEDGSGGACADGKALVGARGLAVSPDGLHVYVASSQSDSVAAFSRNAQSGVLTQLSGIAGCQSEDGSGGACADGKALDGARGVAVSPDGQHVYVVSETSDAVAVFTRSGNGALSQLAGTNGCVSEDGSGGTCANGRALDGAYGVAVSPDGLNVYVASDQSHAVAVFSRNPASGVLTQLSATDGCVSEDGSAGQCANGKALNAASSVIVSQDGKHAYVAAFSGNAIAAFSRSGVNGALSQLPGVAGCVSQTGSSGDCTVADRVDSPLSLAMATKGKALFFVSIFSDTIGGLKRNKKSGALSPLVGVGRCVSEAGSGGNCSDGRALDGARGLAASPVSREVYVAANEGDAVAAFSYNGRGKLFQAQSAVACVSETGSGGACIDGKGLNGAIGAAVSPDGRHIYITSFVSSAVAVIVRQ